jgi:hypothetical protein|tara:strand:+ start:204 stop:326 length:123 start_codon:yes stop_codon:yes gene_type:complete
MTEQEEIIIERFINYIKQEYPSLYDEAFDFAESDKSYNDE